MTVSFKAPVKSAVVNNAFVSKQANDVKVGQLGLNKASEGNQIFSVQKSVNELFDVTGTGEGDPNAKNYNNNNYIADGDSHKTAIEKLDAQVKNNADTIGDHINEALDAHDASAVSYDNTDSGLAAINAQDAIDEVELRLDTAETNISNHINNATDAHDASAISYVNTTSGLTAINAQAAIDEVEGRLGTAESDIQAIEDSIGQANGIAPLNGSSKIDATYLPSYVDDVLEYADIASLPLVGEQGKIYVTIDTNKTYRWTGSIYVEISASPVTSVNSQTGVVVLDADDIAETATRYWSKKNNVANTMPLVGNDASENYSVGSQWYDAINDTLYICEDATIGAAVWQPISGAGGGVGSVDIMFADTFENTDIADYTITQPLASISAVSPLQGENSLLIAHDFNPSYYIERIIPVDNKFKNKNVTFTLDVFSNAASGDLTLSVWDHTNTVQLLNSELIQPQDVDQTSAKRSFSFNIPSGANELRYRINVLFDSGKVSRVDNLVIELTQMSKLDTTIEVPVMTDWVDAGPVQITATTTNPTKGVTAVDKVWVRRNGTNMDVRFEYRQTSAGAAGSGDYLFSIPSSFGAYSGLQIDTTKVTPYSVIEGGIGGFLTNNSVGNVTINAASVETATGSVLVYDTSKVRLSGVYSNGSSSNQGVVANNFFSLGNTSINYAASFSVPILGWEATETQSVSLAQTVLVQESDSYFRIGDSTASSRGLTATNVVYFPDSPTESIGDAIQFLSDSANGSRWIAQKEGIYHFYFDMDFSVVVDMVIAKNAAGSELLAATNPLLIDQSKVLARSYDNGSNYVPSIECSAYLQVGDTVRLHASAAPLNSDRNTVTVAYNGSLKQLNVSENQKIEIPTSELRMEGASSRGSTATAIVRFDNIAKLRGDAFTVESDATLGTRITMKKKGKLDIAFSLVQTSASSFGISKNQATLTAVPTTSSEVLAREATDTGGQRCSTSVPTFVEIGDVIRVFGSANPSIDSANSLNLTFQEQEVSVSVTNVLPQFSESDSSVRVDTANGYGSTATRIRRFSNVRDNLGSAITYADSATNGSSFTINEDGIYSISYNESIVGSSYFGISKNTSSLTTNIISTPIVERLAMEYNDTSTGSYNVSWQGYLQAGDIIRPHTDAGVASSGQISFTISKVGKPNVTGVDVTPFAKIEYEVKQFIESLTATSTFGGTRTGVPVLNITKNTNNGLIRVDSSAANGTEFVALKRCSVNVSASVLHTNSSSVYITKNSTIFTLTAPDGIIAQQSGPASFASNVCAEFEANAGDIVRVQRDAAALSAFNDVSVTATELRDAYQVIGGGVENTYSAIISSAPSIQTQSYPFIDSVTSGGTGVYNINLKAGFFPVIPSVSATSLDGNGRIAAVTSVTTSSITVRTFNDAGTNTGSPFSILVQRQGSDYRTPSKAIGLPAQRIAYVQRTVGPATSAGTSVAGSWNTIPLATVQDPSGIGVSLASNIITLPAGTYDIKAMSAHRSADTQIRMRNITDSSTALVGLSAYGSNASDAAIVTSTAEGIITLNSAKTFELQYRVAIGITFGLGGMGSNFAENVLTASVKIVKLEE